MLYKVRVNVALSYDKLIEAESEAEARLEAPCDYRPWAWAGESVAPADFKIKAEPAKRVSFYDLSYPMIWRATSMGHTGWHDAS